jgi:hypothetical protein
MLYSFRLLMLLLICMIIISFIWILNRKIFLFGICPNHGYHPADKFWLNYQILVSVESYHRLVLKVLLELKVRSSSQKKFTKLFSLGYIAPEIVRFTGDELYTEKVCFQFSLQIIFESYSSRRIYFLFPC